MSEYTLSNSAAVIDAAISSVAGADNTPTASSQNMVTSGGVKNYVDTAIASVDADTAAIEADVLELQTAFTRETFNFSGAANSASTLATFTAPAAGLYIGTLIGSFPRTTSNGFANIKLWWQNNGETLDVNTESYVTDNSLSVSFTRNPVILPQGGTIVIRTTETGDGAVNTYNLTFTISRIA